MPEKFKNKFQIKSARLQGYDYSQIGVYFITVCTKNREEFFGLIKNGKMELNELGKIADDCWQEIPKHFPFVKLDVHQIMPNHLHANLEIINHNSVETPNLGVSGCNKSLSDKAPNLGVSGCNETTKSLKTPGSDVSTKRGGYNNHWQSGCLGVIINQYKRACTIKIRQKLNPITFAWQSRFYDHIVRNEIELNKIREL